MIRPKQHKELIEYYNQFETEDPPSHIYDHVCKYWRNINGDQHRENDRPAFINEKGFLNWCINHKWHRKIGPARIWPGGRCEYWIGDVEITPRDWFKRIMEL